VGRTSEPLDDEAVDGILHEAGLRSTIGRRHIVQSLAMLGHATPEDIFTAVSQAVPDLNLSTVYRTLETLADVGLAVHTHLHSTSRTYYLADGDDHAHLVCDGCGLVATLSGPSLIRFVASIERRGGFAVDIHHLAIHGTCRLCRADLPDA